MIPISASNGGGFIKDCDLSAAIGAFMLRMSGYDVAYQTGRIVEEVTDEVWLFNHRGHIYRVTEIKAYSGIHLTTTRIHFDYIREATNDKSLVRRWQTVAGSFWYELHQDDYSFSYTSEHGSGDGRFPPQYTRQQALEQLGKMIATSGINYIEVANDHDPDVTDATGYVVRVGDADDYHVEQNLVAVAKRLRLAGIYQVINEGAYRFTGLRNAGKDFKGNNFISLFHGRHSERHGSRDARTLTNQEVKDLNRALRK